MKRFVLFCIIAVFLSGCAAPVAQPEPTVPAVELPKPQIALPEETEPPSEPTVPVNTITYQYHTEDLKEYARIIAQDQDHNEVWVYETPHIDMAQLQRVSPIGSWNDRYYFVEDRAVVALDIATGEVLWKNSDFGGCPASTDAVAIDDDGTVYLCGYFGPDFFAVSADGNTLKKVDTFNADYYWAHKLEKQDFAILVYFSGGPEGDMGPEAHSVSVDLPLT